MNKSRNDFGPRLAWIWLTPEGARRKLQQSDTARDITFERRGQGSFAKAS